jgi:hypothetical protein
MNVHDNFSAEYAGICLIAMGCFSAGCIIICWYVMNLHGHIQRSIGSAFMIGFGNSGGIIATFSFLAADAPLYHTGYSICMGAACICTLSASLYGILAYLENRKLRKADRDGELDMDGRKIKFYSM